MSSATPADDNGTNDQSDDYSRASAFPAGPVDPFGGGSRPSDHVASRIADGTRYDDSPFSGDVEPDSTSTDAYDGLFGKEKEGPGLLGVDQTESVPSDNADDDRYRRPKPGVPWWAVFLLVATTSFLAVLADDAAEYYDFLDDGNLFERVFGERTDNDSSTNDSQPASDPYMSLVYTDSSSVDSFVPWDEQCGTEGIATDSGIRVYLDERGWGGCQAYNPLDSGWPSDDAEGMVLGCWAPDRDNAIAYAAAGKVLGEDFGVHQWGAGQSYPEPYCALYPASGA